MDEWNQRRSPLPEDGRPQRHGGDRREREASNKQALDDKLDEGLRETFPGSDAVAVIQPRRSAPARNGR